MMNVKSVATALILSTLLAGCSWFGEKEKPPLPGDRVAVLLFDNELKVDPEVAELAVRLPRPVENTEWRVPGGRPSHVMHHLALGESPRVLWRADAGTGSSDSSVLTAAPVVAGGRVFTMDAEGEISAFEAQDGRLIWEFETTPEDEDAAVVGGGVAYAEGRIFAGTGYAEVIAVSAADGKQVWRSPVPAPVRSAPTVTDGRVFVVTLDNQIIALNAQNGERLWGYAGISEVAGLLGGASPAVDRDLVIAPFSSGEIFALRAENGRVLWSDNLTAVRRVDAVSSLADIRGRPVIDRDMVFALSHSGRMVGVDRRLGARIWERDIGGVEMPWVAGDYVFILTNNSQLVALTRAEGRIRWITGLPRFEDEEDREDPISWAGPVLAGDRLILAGSDGKALSVSPYTGEVLGEFDLPDGVTVAPVVAGNTVYFITNDAELIALR
ncbi:PQQ-like beta-propeller repeat protein [Oceanibaculum pacificum]|uniref:Pyrrolo-quinoline quinone n=1 Tax=Oceanibaculum pacificum TaxID=580166 RepID=A0A154WER2_9PROT|nr:PQQ-like beta-propeller repeat protein [Oceanibaculum pacificum]KZD11955.1 pyrrolo-quinoline quinone [Oceanibaculum pacificum]